MAPTIHWHKIRERQLFQSLSFWSCTQIFAFFLISLSTIFSLFFCLKIFSLVFHSSFNSLRVHAHNVSTKNWAPHRWDPNSQLEPRVVAGSIFYLLLSYMMFARGKSGKVLSLFSHKIGERNWRERFRELYWMTS